MSKVNIKNITKRGEGVTLTISKPKEKIFEISKVFGINVN